MKPVTKFRRSYQQKPIEIWNQIQNKRVLKNRKKLVQRKIMEAGANKSEEKRKENLLRNYRI